ncbi:BON domain-containing protein [Bdellovibrio sp. BCCA]|uniref:BON domain-containing protein n=1 Tax=Bdellovibrio sp. BCCA TaxID=3136281 RepID=UPI0030F0472F
MNTNIKWISAVLIAASFNVGLANDREHTANQTNQKTINTTNQKTAEDQMMNASDTELTRRVREQIVADNSLSVNAKNVKIISQNGRVTLKGPVDSTQERNKIETIAKSVSGAKIIVNETVVK